MAELTLRFYEVTLMATAVALLVRELEEARTARRRCPISWWRSARTVGCRPVWPGRWATPELRLHRVQQWTDARVGTARR